MLILLKKPPLFKKERFAGPPKHSNYAAEAAHKRSWRILSLTNFAVFWAFSKMGVFSAESNV
jgi:hypothetical protein